MPTTNMFLPAGIGTPRGRRARAQSITSSGRGTLTRPVLHWISSCGSSTHLFSTAHVPTEGAVRDPAVEHLLVESDDQVGLLAAVSRGAGEADAEAPARERAGGDSAG
jgi:hypothetical protein